MPVVSRREIFIPEGHDNGEVLTLAQKMMHHSVRLLLEVVIRLYFRLEVHGRENIPKRGPFIISPIHRSYLDTPVIGASIWRLLRYMGAEKMWTNKRSVMPSGTRSPAFLASQQRCPRSCQYRWHYPPHDQRLWRSTTAVEPSYRYGSSPSGYCAMPRLVH